MPIRHSFLTEDLRFYGIMVLNGGLLKIDGKGEFNNYVDWMSDRLKECYRVLKRTGTMYLHCDHHASHYLKVEMDDRQRGLFDERNFINEIVWQRNFARHSDAKQGSKHFGRVHDVILFYAKSKQYTWNTQYDPMPEESLKKQYKDTDPRTGKKCALIPIDGPGGAAKGNPKYEFLGVT